MENVNIKEKLEEVKEHYEITHLFNSLPLKDKIIILEQQVKLLRMIANSSMTVVRRWKKELEE